MRVAEVDALTTRSLRMAILRAADAASSTAPGDGPGARHLAAFDDDTVVGAVVLIRESCPLWRDRTAYRVRGMAVTPERQGQGIGALLLAAAVETAAGADLVWCNARSTARRFYERHDFVAAGDEFVTPDTGVEHFLMYRNLRETPPRPTQ